MIKTRGRGKILLRTNHSNYIGCSSETLSRGLDVATGREGTIFSSVKVRLNNSIYKINK